MLSTRALGREQLRYRMMSLKPNTLRRQSRWHYLQTGTATMSQGPALALAWHIVSPGTLWLPFLGTHCSWQWDGWGPSAVTGWLLNQADTDPWHNPLPGDSPCPDGGGREDPLDEGRLVGVEAEEVTGGVDTNQDTEGVEGQAAGGEVTGPPRAQPHEEQVVDAGGGGGQGDPWGAVPRGRSVRSRAALG